MESLLNFIMGFSTALLPAMAYTAYYFRKSGQNATKHLERTLQQSQWETSAAKQEIAGLKKIVAETQRNNITLTDLKEDAEKRMKKAEDQARKQAKAQVQAQARAQREALEKSEQSSVAKTGESSQFHGVRDFAGYVYVISDKNLFGEDRYIIEASKDVDSKRFLESLTGEVTEDFEVHMVLFRERALDLRRKLHKALTNHQQDSESYTISLFDLEFSRIQEAMDKIHREEAAKESGRSASKEAATGSLKKAA